MLTLTFSFNSTALHIVAADVLILLSYVLFLFHKKRNIEKSVANITDFITSYFLQTGAEVQVDCFRLDTKKHFVVLIESKPLKRFRFSNILESNLIGHIYKTTGNVVEKIYWRFPVQIQDKAIVIESQQNSQSDDSYFQDVKVVSDTSPTYNVSEASWDEFRGAQ